MESFRVSIAQLSSLSARSGYTEQTIKELRPWLGTAHNIEQRSLGYQKGRDFPFQTLSLLKIKERP